jgi:predicted transglutaminase-like cysteine proteinase
VNLAWNAAVKPMEDAAHYGVVDYWTVPKDGYGDCEDYALGKRQSLIAYGLPAQALSIAVVRTVDGTAHAVLAVATDQGAYVLDNLASAVLPWTTTHYIGVAHQVGGQSEWASLGASVGDDRSIATANIIPQ